MTLPISTPMISSRPDTSGPESVRKDTRLLLVSNDAMRARRRPRAVLWLYLWQLVVAFGLAWPASRAIGAVFAGHPRGASVLFDDGGWALLALRHGWERTSPALAAMVLFALFAGALLGLVPLIALLVSMSHATPKLEAPRARHVAPYLVASYAPMTWLLILASGLELALLLIALRVASWASGLVVARWGDARADLFGVGLGALVLLLAVVVGVVHDLARAALARYRGGARSAIWVALGTLRRAPARLLWSWTWRTLAGWVAVLVVGAVAARLGSTTLTLIVLVVLHQAAALARVMFRASWLARALRAVDLTR